MRWDEPLDPEQVRARLTVQKVLVERARDEHDRQQPDRPWSMPVEEYRARKIRRRQRSRARHEREDREWREQALGQYGCCWPECREFQARYRHIYRDGAVDMDSEYEASPLCVLHLYGAWAIAQDTVDYGRRKAFEWELREAVNINSQEEFKWSDAPTARRSPQPKQPGTLYYLRCDGYIKVGYATVLANRLRQYPPSIELLAARPGSRAEEAAEHSLLQEYRAWRREWYHPVEPVMRHIEGVVRRYGEVPQPAEVVQRRPAPVKVKAKNGGRW